LAGGASTSFDVAGRIGVAFTSAALSGAPNGSKWPLHRGPEKAFTVPRETGMSRAYRPG